MSVLEFLNAGLFNLSHKLRNIRPLSWLTVGHCFAANRSALRPHRLTNNAARLRFCVSVLRIEFRQGSPHLPALGLWLDAHEPQVERVFVSHAHSDHIAE